MLKPNDEICLKCECQLKQKTKCREKNIEFNKNCMLWKVELHFPDPKLNLFYVIADIFM